MAEVEPSENSNRTRIRQPISVPFVWEEKPGTPKKDWKPSTQRVNPVVPLPVKLVASIPFEWEEKPGTPLRRFSQPPQEIGIQLPPEKLIELDSPLTKSTDSGDENGSEEEQYRIFKSDDDGYGFETDGSFCSAPSVPTSCLVSSLAVSNAVPILETSRTGNNSGELKSPSSPDSENSYATGTSLVGEAFLECLFPLLSSPHTSFLEKHGRTEKSSSNIPRKVQSKDFDRESNCSVAVRRSLTLGELLMMSSRISYRRKEVQMQLPMETMKNRAIGRCIFRINSWMGINHWIEGLQRKWKRQLRLKLM
ncbi:hypothetical protein RHSIM_Rhsim03G0172300 [Rhododendron simsii]|uniref:Hydroxyproline-rich glycoprotein family protein n=1 Tax=Rhododendron simsii TaxID=118357 RepID=A0A834LTF5_RHOSS|nr:hypothetical protein RHSIM_Rhsim03G0172300 [Rhododendron simsii]